MVPLQVSVDAGLSVASSTALLKPWPVFTSNPQPEVDEKLSSEARTFVAEESSTDSPLVTGSEPATAQVQSSTQSVTEQAEVHPCQDSNLFQSGVPRLSARP